MDEAAVARLIAYTRAQGGGTFDRDTLEPVTSINCHHGYAVGITSNTYLRGLPESMTDMTVCIAAVQHDFPFVPYIGTWFDGEDNLIHIDPVVIVHDYFDAFTIARAFGQKAVYSFGERRVLDV